ncbi:unnamed protein product [Candida verbasci]|uniref:DUF21-domain-containing protein n=1 Tax=Candida verbasci TaxID=1227364 RepID=A0A9W4TXW8_9ASCO|nr:unnamed protein product [Candida verbasci]
MSKKSLSSSNHVTTTVSLNSFKSTAITKILFIFSNLFKLVYSIPIHKSTNNDFQTEHKKHDMTPEEFYINLFTSMFLVLAGGVFAGLTLGLMGQDEVYLKVIATSGDKNERKHANKVLQLIGKGKHWVLVTLLLSNVITNETLPIVLDRCLGGGWPAVVTSTVSIVIFGEIIPQSICVRYGLQVGSLFSPFVLVLMYIMYPVAYPCALLLDHILGEDHGTVYKKSGLKTLVTLHKTMGVERLNQDEVTIISAVLDLKEKAVSSIMTPMDRVYTMSADTLLDEKTVEEIFNAGFSRIPIHLPNEPNNFIGMLLVRVLISYDPEDSLPVASFPLATLPETGLDTSCLNILNYFQEGKSHMIIVSEHPGEPTGAVGVLTLEDVIEELIGEEIVDESDVYIDINKNIKRKHPGPLSKRNLTSYLHNLYQRSDKNNGSINSKRNSIDSQQSQTQVDLRERLRKGSSQSILTTPNLNKKKVKEDSNLSTTPNAKSKWKIKNPALNPLETNKSFVTIKRPDQGTIDSVTKAASPAPETNRKEQLKQAQQQDKNTEVGIYSSEQNAIDEAKRRSLDQSRANSRQQFLLPNERETDVSEINGDKEEHNQENQQLPIAINNSNGVTLYDQQSRSYRTGGIVESVINVQGVHKTIIENVSDREDMEIIDPKYKSKKSKKNKKKKRSPSSTIRSDSFGLNKYSDENENENDSESVEEEEENQSLLKNNNGNGRKNSRSSSISSSSKKFSVWDKLKGNTSE